MKKLICLTAMVTILPFAAFAEEGKEAKDSSFRVNFRRVALDISSTEVKNADEYQDSSVSALSADGETVVKGVFDGVLEYEHADYQWNNSLFMEYGKKTTKPVGRPHTTDRNADQILLTTDYSHKMWRYMDADVGPFASLSYETKFHEDEDNPRTKIIRPKAGLKLWNGQYIKELYVAAVGEHDMTYDEDVDKFAMEIGGRFEYELRDGVTFKLDGYYRKYMHWSEYAYEDLKYDLNVNGRMDVKLVDKISLAPFMAYRLAESRGAGVSGSNFQVGVSLSYADVFDIW